MQQSINEREKAAIVLDNIMYLIGSPQIIANMQIIAPKSPFSEEVLYFLNEVSKALLADAEAKAYSDVVTFAFWIRRASTAKMKERFNRENGDIRFGRGVVFHIAPSNVAVNYAYSLAVSLLTGNANVVRVPSKDFPQISIINAAISDVLAGCPGMIPYICLVKYGREQAINDVLSSFADVRIIWGGDATIKEIRKSQLAPRSGEITFASRFSLAVIDSGSYMDQKDKAGIAEGFYNDTYLSDQNACTSPRMVVWTGDRKEEAKKVFWENLHVLVEKKYTFQPIQGINKLTSSYLSAVSQNGVKIEKYSDNLIIRVKLMEIRKDVMEFKDNSGFFFEYDCDDILELRELCNDKRCQTLAYIGSKEMLLPLLKSGARGIDRVVPVGKTMDFDFVWDGYNLYEHLTRIIRIME